MTEEILSYLWQFQRFNHKELETYDGRKLSVYSPGLLNQNAGPDFSEARIKIGFLEWYGNVELHVNSSDWDRHEHSSDQAYKNVILHVVWNHDKAIKVGVESIPVLELKGKVSHSLLVNAENLLQNLEDIPCANSRVRWESLQVQSALEKAAIERLERKCKEIEGELNKVSGDWEETLFRKFSANLGFKVNKDPFYRLATHIGHKLVLKCSGNLMRTEALFQGASRHLDINLHHLHFKELVNEFIYLRKKYRIRKMSRPGWKYLRMRPANFPASRIAQLAAIYHSHPNLFRKIIEAASAKEIRAILKNKTSQYWETHYLFGPQCSPRNTELGEEAVNLIIINTIIPFLFSYGKLQEQPSYADKALKLLQELPGEKNKIIRKWEKIGMRISTALHSQGAIELYTNWCIHKKCMQCKIGIHILSGSTIK